RVNSRLDEAYGFEKHFLRGLKKMRLRCTLALMVMLAMAVGRIREKQSPNMRSLVKAA
ncbi:MAG: DDE transposase, partial [Bacillota bacterium]